MNAITLLKRYWMPLVGGLCVILGLGLMLATWSGASAPAPLPPATSTAEPEPSPTATPRPTSTPEPIVPTRTPSPTPTRIPTETPEPTATATLVPLTPRPTHTPGPSPTLSPTLEPTATPEPTAAPPPAGGFIVPPHERHRLGISIPYGAPGAYDLLGPLGVGWVMDWSARGSVNLPPGVQYAQTVRMRGGVLRPNAETLTGIAAARPGSLWLISNEADVRWQDNVEPQVYARLYHEAYHAIKAGDPGAVVAAGGIAQPTPLRMRYLDIALQTYQAEFGAPLPAQAWHIHNYMLREERDSWGVDIPPGIPDNTGKLYSIEDSGNLDLFRAQIYDFRRWMVSRGYGGQPLIVSEFGVPMPEDYGFPPERMAEFLRETWRFFLTATDGALGDPNDGGRLVQRWCWFSMAYPYYPTGNLLDENNQWTPLARTWLSYVGD